ncbi:MAG: iron ABC transporter permease [Planctomycetota bacterium]
MNVTAPSSPRRTRAFVLVLVLVFSAVTLASLNVGPAGSLGALELGRGLLGVLGFDGDVDERLRGIVALRAKRTLVGIGVGAALAYSGALLQGVFRNDLASPAVLGVTSGASLGAAIAILGAGGYGPVAAFVGGTGSSLIVSLSAFAGAASVLALVTAVGTRAGSVSVPTLLLAGVAVNAVVGGMLAALQAFALRDFEIARALFAWAFGQIEDRGAHEITALYVALFASAACLPFVARELDLFVAGEHDARSLGVDAARVKWLALGAAGLSAGVAVSVVGQIAFVGLVVPHLLRLAVGRSHRILLPLSLLGGATFLVGCDLVQRLFLEELHLHTGVWMSLIGGPLFLVLLVRDRRSLEYA